MAGLAYEELHQFRGGDFHRFWHSAAQHSAAHEAARGGERFLDLGNRASRAVHQLVEMYSGDIIVVKLGSDPEAALAFTIENCSITRIDHIDGPRWVTAGASSRSIAHRGDGRRSSAVDTTPRRACKCISGS
jgi:broad specificity phosphatase PhoE